MRKYFFVLLILFALLGGSYFLVWPNTFLSQMDISFWPKDIVRKILEQKSRETITIVVENREVVMTPSELGVVLDVERTIDQLKFRSVSEFVDRWGKSLSRMSFVQPVYVVDENFKKIANEKLNPKEEFKESYEYDNKTGLFVYRATESEASIDIDDLLTKMTLFSEIKSSPIEINKFSKLSDLAKKVEKVNEKLLSVLTEPLEIVIEERNKNIKVSPEEVRGFTNVESLDNLETIDMKVEKKSLLKILANSGIDNISIDWVAKKIKLALLDRYQGGEPKQIVLGVDTGPNTDGNLAKNYIEVDLSQQKLYLFERGEIYKSYPVSTGLYYPTPVGSYKIQNKAEIGFSKIFDVWMPWWMAFDYRPDLGAYLGIHELPYMLIGGEKVYRFGNYIGTRKTGGCIALAPGDSKEVFDRSFSGMDLVIYQ